MSDLKVVAKGNMSIVLADNTNSVAYKCIPHTSTCKTAFCGALKDEFNILNNIKHPCIIKSYNFYSYTDMKDFNEKNLKDDKDDL